MRGGCMANIAIAVVGEEAGEGSNLEWDKGFGFGL